MKFNKEFIETALLVFSFITVIGLALYIYGNSKYEPLDELYFDINSTDPIGKKDVPIVMVAGFLDKETFKFNPTIDYFETGMVQTLEDKPIFILEKRDFEGNIIGRTTLNSSDRLSETDDILNYWIISQKIFFEHNFIYMTIRSANEKGAYSSNVHTTLLRQYLEQVSINAESEFDKEENLLLIIELERAYTMLDYQKMSEIYLKLKFNASIGLQANTVGENEHFLRTKEEYLNLISDLEFRALFFENGNPKVNLYGKGTPEATSTSKSFRYSDIINRTLNSIQK